MPPPSAGCWRQCPAARGPFAHSPKPASPDSLCSSSHGLLVPACQLSHVLRRMRAAAFRAHLDNPRQPPHLTVINLITSAKMISPYEVTFTGCRDQGPSVFWGPLWGLLRVSKGKWEQPFLANTCWLGRRRQMEVPFLFPTRLCLHWGGGLGPVCTCTRQPKGVQALAALPTAVRRRCARGVCRLPTAA